MDDLACLCQIQLNIHRDDFQQLVAEGVTVGREPMESIKHRIREGIVQDIDALGLDEKD